MDSNPQSEFSSRELKTVVSLKFEAWRRQKREPSTATDVKVLDILRREYSSTRSTSFNGIATDFDGTLAYIAKRDDGPPSEITSKLLTILEKGCVLVVISGRGRSIQRFLEPLAKKGNKVFLCLYNGAKIIEGSSGPTLFERFLQSSEEIHQILSLDPILASSTSRIDIGKYGIQLFPREGSIQLVYSQVKKLVVENGFDDSADVKSSGWTVDITSKGTDKGHALDIVRDLIDEDLKDDDFLKLGDQGHNGGNDFELLKRRHSFSVDTISADLSTCFPIVDSKGRRICGLEGTDLVLTRTVFEGI